MKATAWTVYGAVVLAVVPLGAGELDPGLQRHLATADGEVRAVVVMRPATRGRAAGSVTERLAAEAAAAQADLLRSLASRGRGGELRSVKVINAVVVRGSAALLREIAARADVETVYGDRPVQLVQPLRGDGRAGSERAWGIERCGAPEAWRRGIDGRGTVIGSIDTGVDVAHPALRGRFVGGPDAWRDYVNGRREPYDDNGHGTHTVGTACGGAGPGGSIGVAPGARFIAAKVLDRRGAGSTADILLAMDFMLDPDGDPTTDDAPDVVNNSWGSTGSAPFFERAIDNWIAAGIVPVFAIGNEGPAGGTTAYPGNYTQCIGVGALGLDDRLAPFSSRGPVRYGGRLYIKPDLSAPGVGVLSALPGGRYGRHDGTSMAAPHVAGTVALLRQARPELSVDEVRRTLVQSAYDLGERGADNLYGAGRLQADRAIERVLGGAPVEPTPTPWPSPSPEPVGESYAAARIQHPRPDRVMATLGARGDPFTPLTVRFVAEGERESGTSSFQTDLSRYADWMDGRTEWYLRLVDRDGRGGQLLSFAIVTPGGRRAVRNVPAAFGPQRTIEARVTPAAVYPDSPPDDGGYRPPRGGPDYNGDGRIDLAELLRWLMENLGR